MFNFFRKNFVGGADEMSYVPTLAALDHTLNLHDREWITHQLPKVHNIFEVDSHNYMRTCETVAAQ